MTVRSLLPDDDLDPILLDRYWLGETTLQERDTIDAWFQAHPGQRDVLERLRQDIAAGTGKSLTPAEVDGRVKRILAMTGVPASPTHCVQRPRRGDRDSIEGKARFSGRLARVSLASAGAVAVLVCAGVFWQNARTGHANLSDATHTYRTAPGQRATVHLRDGVQAILGPATRFVVSGSMDNRGVTIALDGEALFRVPHADRLPFQVSTTNAVARVLGTTFLVRKYTTDAASVVVVQDGRVAISIPANLSPSSQPYVLARNMLGVVGDSGTVRVTDGVRASDYMAWTEGRLVFRKTPVREIVTELNRAYGARIRLADSTLAVRELTWMVPVDELSLRSALDALAAVLGAHLQPSDSTIMLVPGRKAEPGAHERQPLPSMEREYGR